MTTQMRSYGRGLRMPLLALTASASIVGGVFVAAQPAYSVDGVVGASGQCLTAADEGASIVVSSVVPVGSPLHVAGSGWGATSETLRGFVIVTLDDGQEVRPDGVTLPAWVPASVVRNKTAWSVAEVSTTGTFSADIELLSTWVVGSEHSIMIGDGVTGTYVQVSVTVVEADAQAHACSLTPTDEPSAAPDGHATSDVATDGPTESPADDAVDNAAKPVVDLTDDASSDAGSDASASAPPNAPATPAPRTTPRLMPRMTSRARRRPRRPPPRPRLPPGVMVRLPLAAVPARMPMPRLPPRLRIGRACPLRRLVPRLIRSSRPRIRLFVSRSLVLMAGSLRVAVSSPSLGRL